MSLARVPLELRNVEVDDGIEGAFYWVDGMNTAGVYSGTIWTGYKGGLGVGDEHGNEYGNEYICGVGVGNDGGDCCTSVGCGAGVGSYDGDIDTMCGISSQPKNLAILISVLLVEILSNTGIDSISLWRRWTKSLAVLQRSSSSEAS